MPLADRVRQQSCTKTVVKKLAALPIFVALVGFAWIVPANVGAASTADAASPAFGTYDGSTTPPKALDSALNGGVTYAMDFQDGTSWSSITQSSWPYSQWRGKGYSMVWGIPMLPGSYSPSSSLSKSGGSCYGLSQEADGSFNTNFTKVAQALVTNGFGSSVVRLGWEFNLGWTPWSANGCAAQFVGAFQQIVTTMRAVSGANFTFEWNPSLGDQGVGNLANYYPGSSYVDYVGLDVYDTGWGTYPGAQAEFDSLLAQPDGLDWLTSFAAAKGKQIVLPEWGLGWGACNAGRAVNAPNQETCGGDDATFINDMASWIKTDNVFEVTFWDYGTSTVAGCPMACTSIGSSDGDNSAIAAGNINSFNALVADFGSGSSPGPSASNPSNPPDPPNPPNPPNSSTPSPPALNGPSTAHVSPHGGPTIGGTTVTIAGTGLADPIAVDFGSVPATIVSASATSITATAPPAASGTVDVTVTTPLGTSQTSANDQYSYTLPPETTTPSSTAASSSASSSTSRPPSSWHAGWRQHRRHQGRAFSAPRWSPLAPHVHSSG